jgi:hypothetical protein
MLIRTGNGAEFGEINLVSATFCFQEGKRPRMLPHDGIEPLRLLKRQISVDRYLNVGLKGKPFTQ